MFQLLSEFTRSRLGKTDAQLLERRSAKLSGGSLWLTTSLLGVLVAAASFLLGVTRPQVDPTDGALAMSYGAFWPRFHDTLSEGRLWLPFVAWTLGLTVAYGSYLLSVHLHARAIRDFLDEFNRTVVLEEGLSPVLLGPIGYGSSPLWVLGAAVLLFFSCGWSLAFAMAGATERRLRRRALPAVQEQLADRVRELVHMRPERPRLTSSSKYIALCPKPGCGQPLQRDTKFCPRCGTRRSGPIDREA